MKRTNFEQINLQYLQAKHERVWWMKTSKLNLDIIPRPQIDDENLEYCKTIQNLCVIFDKNITFEKNL